MTRSWLVCGVMLLTAVHGGFAQAEGGARTISPVMRGDVLVARQHYMEAIRVYESIATPDAAVVNKLGVAYEHMRLLPQAKQRFEQAMAMDPRLPGPENNLGTVYYVEGDLRKAEQHYRRALKGDPRNASIYSNLGTLYFSKHKLHKGAEAYQQALSLDPDIFQRTAERGIQTEGDRESRALINYYLAQTCAQAGQARAALRYLQRAVDAGFHDGAKLRADGHFAAMRESPEFRDELLAVVMDAERRPGRDAVVQPGTQVAAVRP